MVLHKVVTSVLLIACLGACFPRSEHRSSNLYQEYDCEHVGNQTGDFCITPQFAGGRLGNQLFEVAESLSIAKDNNCTAVFPMFLEESSWSTMNTWGVPYDKLFAPYLSDSDNAIFSKKRLGPNRDSSSLSCFTKKFEETTSLKRSDYTAAISKELPVRLVGMKVRKMALKLIGREKGWGMFGYMSAELFSHNMSYIQDTLGPSKTQKKALTQRLAKHGLTVDGKTTASIHLRFGDRQNLLWKALYPSATAEYFLNSIKLLETTLEKRDQSVDVYVVFSDDLKKAKEMLSKSFPNENSRHFFFVDYKSMGNKDYEDLWLMSTMDHNIITNSTFSFWGAYLNENPNKVVIQPDTWFGPAPEFLEQTFRTMALRHLSGCGFRVKLATAAG